MKNDCFKSAFILGGTSTIAKKICIKLAENGCKKFHLVSRETGVNNQLIEKLRIFYKAKVTEERNDLLLNTSLVKKFNPKVDFYDIYLIASGFIGNNNLANSNSEEALKINSVNYAGIIPWLIEIMTEKRIKHKGSLWILSSVASDRGRPSNYHYGASKAALSIFSEGLLLRCVDKPFSVRIIKAGYISTPMTVGAPKFLCTSPTKVASILMKDPYKRGIEYLPWWWNLIMIAVRRLPSFLAARL